MQEHQLYFFLDIPRIFLEQKMMYHGYFYNINAFSTGKRNVLLFIQSTLEIEKSNI